MNINVEDERVEAKMLREHALNDRFCLIRKFIRIPVRSMTGEQADMCKMALHFRDWQAATFIFEYATVMKHIAEHCGLTPLAETIQFAIEEADGLREDASWLAHDTLA